MSGGNVQLWFNAPIDWGYAINEALQYSYPTVGSFNCPDN